MPGPNIEEFARQMQGVQLVSTHNAQRANVRGLSGKESKSRLAAWLRALRYEADIDGWKIALQRRFGKKRS